MELDVSYNTLLITAIVTSSFTGLLVYSKIKNTFFIPPKSDLIVKVNKPILKDDTPVLHLLPAIDHGAVSASPASTKLGKIEHSRNIEQSQIIFWV